MARAEEHARAELKSKQGWCLGILFVILVSVFWTIASILVQYITHDLGYNHPFILTYIGSGVMTTCIPAYVACASLGLVQNPPLRCTTDSRSRGDSERETGSIADGEAETRAFVSDVEAYHSCADGLGGRGKPDHVPLSGKSEAVDSTRPSDFVPVKSHMFMFKAGLSISLMWYLAQWGYVVSLASTSLTSSTIISHSTALFAYLFNVLAKTESFTLLKTAGVALALVGAAVVGWGDRDDSESSDSLLGDMAALLSSVAYGLYSTILTLRAPSDEEVSMTLITGYTGVSCVLSFLPVLLTLAIAPEGHFLSGLTFYIFQIIIGKSILDDILCGLLWARAMLLTTPTVATVGCSLTIPTAFVADFFVHGKVPDTHAVVGASMVLAGFVFVSGRGSEGGGETAPPVLTHSRPGYSPPANLYTQYRSMP